MSKFITYQEVGVGNGTNKTFSITIDSTAYINHSFFLLNNGVVSSTLTASDASTEIITDMTGGGSSLLSSGSYVRSTGVLSLTFINAPLVGNIIYVKYVSSKLELINRESMHYYDYSYQLSSSNDSLRRINNGYNIYIRGSSATFAIYIHNDFFVNQACNIVCYKATPTNQWVQVGSTSLDKNNKYGFTFNCDSSRGGNVFPEQAVFRWDSDYEYLNDAPQAGNITLTLRNNVYTIPIANIGDNIIEAIVTAVNTATTTSGLWSTTNPHEVFEPEWYAQQNGYSITFCKKTSTFFAGAGFIIDLSGVGITGDYDFYSDGTNVTTGIVNYEDFDCARWRINIQAPYADKKIWASYRVNSYNTPTSQNSDTFLNDNYKYYSIYQWGNEAITKTYTPLTPDSFCSKILTTSSTQIESGNYQQFTIRGKY